MLILEGQNARDRKQGHNVKVVLCYVVLISPSSFLITFKTVSVGLHHRSERSLTLQVRWVSCARSECKMNSATIMMNSHRLGWLINASNKTIEITPRVHLTYVIR